MLLSDGSLLTTPVEGTRDWFLLNPTSNSYEKSVQKQAIKAQVCECLEKQGVGVRESSGKGPKLMHLVCSQKKKVPPSKAKPELKDNALHQKRQATSKRTSDCKFQLKIKWVGDDKGFDYRTPSLYGKRRPNYNSRKVWQSGWWVSGNMNHCGHVKLNPSQLLRGTWVRFVECTSVFVSSCT